MILTIIVQWQQMSHKTLELGGLTGHSVLWEATASRVRKKILSEVQLTHL